jgi:hypothetical protein
MTPKEKARELFNKFFETISTSGYPDGEILEATKNSAVICIDEIIDRLDMADTYIRDLGKGNFIRELEYWHTVKKELILLKPYN